MVNNTFCDNLAHNHNDGVGQFVPLEILFVFLKNLHQIVPNEISWPIS